MLLNFIVGRLKIYKENKLHYATLSLIILIASFFRFFKLGVNDLWLDEACSSSFNASISSGIIFDFQAPLHYLFLKAFIRFFGANEFILRLPSAIFGISSVILLYKIGNVFLNRPIAYLSALILAINPLHIWYAQEARPYSMFVFVTLLNIYIFLKAISSGQEKLFLWCFLASILGLYTSYYFIFLLFAETLIILFLKKYRIYLKKWSIVILSIFFAFLPWLKIFLTQFQSFREGFWLPTPTWKDILFILHNFNLGYNATIFQYVLALIVNTMNIILFFYGWREFKEQKLQTGYLMLLLFVIIWSSIFTIAQVIPIYLSRQIMFISPLYYIVISSGIFLLFKRSFWIAILVGLILLSLNSFSLVNFYLNRMPLKHMSVHLKKPFKDIANFIKLNSDSNDIMIHANLPTLMPLSFFYLHSYGIKHYYSFSFPKEKSYWVNIFKKTKYDSVINFFELGEIEKRGIKQIIGDCNRIWLICSSWERDGTIDENSKSLKRWMDGRYRLLKSQEFSGIFLYIYSINDK